MNRLRLAAIILTAGMTFIGGCTASYTVGNGGSGGLFGGRFFNRNGLCNGINSSAPECCPTPSFATPCCESGIVSGFEGPGPILMPQDPINMVPPGTGIPPGFMPGAIPAPAGSSTKLMPVPQSTPVPYTPTVH